MRHVVPREFARKFPEWIRTEYEYGLEKYRTDIGASDHLPALSVRKGGLEHGGVTLDNMLSYPKRYSIALDDLEEMKQEGASEEQQLLMKLKAAQAVMKYVVSGTALVVAVSQKEPISLEMSAFDRHSATTERFAQRLVPHSTNLGELNTMTNVAAYNVRTAISQDNELGVIRHARDFNRMQACMALWAVYELGVMSAPAMNSGQVTYEDGEPALWPSLEFYQ